MLVQFFHIVTSRTQILTRVEFCRFFSKCLADSSFAQCYTATFPIGTTAHSWQWVAMGQSPVALSGTYYAARVIAESTKKVMEEPALLDRAKQELSGRLGGTSYECPIPKDVWPTKYAKIK